MRSVILAAAAFCALGSSVAIAQRICASNAEVSTFEVAALRSEMMVLAMGCNEEHRYNAFMRKFLPELQANERAVQAYFRKHYGRSAQTEQDRFVTDMANSRSRAATQLGSDHCPRNGLLFAEVMALRTMTELADYAAAKDLLPASMGICQQVTEAQPTRTAAQAKR